MDDRALPCVFMFRHRICGADARDTDGQLPKYRVPLCPAHEREVQRLAVEDHNQRVEEVRFSLEETTRRVRRLERIKGSVSRSGKGWRYSFTIPPSEDGLTPRKQVTRRGFRTKAEASQALKLALLEVRRDAGASISAQQVELETEKLNRIRSSREHRAWLEQQAAEEQQQRSATRRDRERPRHVYYVQRPDGAIKIGTTWNIQSRMQALRNASPVTLLATHTGGQPAESALHRRFAADRLDGEWFAASPALLRHIDHVNAVVQRRSVPAA